MATRGKIVIFLSSVVRHVAQVGAFGAVVRHLDILAHPSSWVITPIFAPRGAVYRPLIGWLSGREHLQVRFIRTLIQKERSFPEASSAVSCSCRRGSPGTAPAGHSTLGFMNGGYVRLSSAPAPSKSTNRTS